MPDQDFFAEEARLARSALRNLAKETQAKVQKHSDIRPLIKNRPWVSLLSAFAGGLVGGYLVTPPRPSPEEKQRNREEKRQKSQQRKAKKQSTSGRIEQQLANAVTPALRTFAATAAGALFHNFQQGAAHSNGHAPAAQQPAPAADDEYADIPHQRMQI